jgi:hypothetical protein
MEWNIIIHDDTGYVEVVTCGIADKDGSLNMAKALSYTMRTRRITRALIDHRNIGEVISKPFDIYNRPKIFRLIGIIFKIKIAEIIRPEHSEHFNFFETVCINQGYHISIFQEKENAMKWLLE